MGQEGTVQPIPRVAVATSPAAKSRLSGLLPERLELADVQAKQSAAPSLRKLAPAKGASLLFGAFSAPEPLISLQHQHQHQHQQHQQQQHQQQQQAAIQQQQQQHVAIQQQAMQQQQVMQQQQAMQQQAMQQQAMQQQALQQQAMQQQAMQQHAMQQQVMQQQALQQQALQMQQQSMPMQLVQPSVVLQSPQGQMQMPVGSVQAMPVGGLLPGAQPSPTSGGRPLDVYYFRTPARSPSFQLSDGP